MGTTDAPVLREPDTTVRTVVTCLDLTNCRFYQPAKFLPLLFGDRCPQVLNLGSMLPHKNDQCHLRNATDPGIANELWIERKQTFRAIWVTTRCSFPVDQAAHPVDFTYRIEIGDKLAASRQHS